jgi:sigma-B regulation protein RsbU (phosphoserine phosphatase)
MSTGELTYACGGHPPPYVLRADGSVETPRQTKGPGLGVTAAATFGTATLRLEPGDGLLCFTDGVTEAMDAEQRMFGTERLKEALRAVGPPQDAQQLTAAVRAAVDAFAAGAEQYDDLTLLGFRRTV